MELKEQQKMLEELDEDIDKEAEKLNFAAQLTFPRSLRLSGHETHGQALEDQR